MAALAGFGFGAWSLWSNSRRPAPGDPAPAPRSPATPRAAAAAAPAPVAAAREPDVAAAGAHPTEAADAPAWVEPVEGTCPLSHPVKANDNSKIFHVPGGRFYDRTKPERCYRSPDEAAADGYRAAKW